MLQPLRAVPSYDQVATHLISTATEAFVELGTEAVTMDLIAQRAGVSRTTVYRRFDSREALFLEVILVRLETFLQRTRTMFTARGMAGDLEELIVLGVIEMPQDPLLRLHFAQGMAGADAVLATTHFVSMVKSAVRPLIDRWAAEGELRPDLELDDLFDWLIHEHFGLANRGPWDEAGLRRYARTFMLPVLSAGASPRHPRQPSTASERDHRLARIEAKLDALLLMDTAETAARKRSSRPTA